MNQKTNSWAMASRLGGLRRFAAAITGFTILGHAFLGFEQSVAQPLIALAVGYSLQLGIELIDAWANRRDYRFSGGFGRLVDFLLPAHISSLAVAMLLYANDRFWPIAFATAVAIASKAIIQLPVNHGKRHAFNPSNFGISITLLLFPWVGIAPPYHFTETLTGIGDWVLPVVILLSGLMLNIRYTRRYPLIIAWVGCFFLQALFRSLVFDTPLTAALLPMTGVAFALYTFYMVTDPPTTPGSVRGQIFFGGGVAVTYGLLMVNHIVFGLFFALTIVSTVRLLGTYALKLVRRDQRDRASQPAAPPLVTANPTIVGSSDR